MLLLRACKLHVDKETIPNSNTYVFSAATPQADQSQKSVRETAALGLNIVECSCQTRLQLNSSNAEAQHS